METISQTLKVPVRNQCDVLVAGRCISGSYMAHAAYRVTGNCLAMGEGAGLGACRAIAENVSIRTLTERGQAV